MTEKPMPRYGKMPDRATRKKCLKFVMQAARKYKIPPVYVTAHVRYMGSSEARREVMRRMITELHIPRCWVAYAFGRDLRRVRKSVLGV